MRGELEIVGRPVLGLMGSRKRKPVIVVIKSRHRGIPGVRRRSSGRHAVQRLRGGGGFVVGLWCDYQ